MRATALTLVNHRSSLKLVAEVNMIQQLLQRLHSRLVELAVFNNLVLDCSRHVRVRKQKVLQFSYQWPPIVLAGPVHRRRDMWV